MVRPHQAGEVFMSRRRSRPARSPKTPSRDSEAPQVHEMVTIPAPPADDAEHVDAQVAVRSGDELAALDAGWD